MSNLLVIGTRRNTIRVDRQIWVETRRLDDWCSEISRQSILFGRTQWAEFAGGIQTLSNTRFDGVALMPITATTGGTPSPPDLGSNAIPAASQVDAIAIPCRIQK